MKNIRFLFCAFACVLFLFSCDKDDDSALSDVIIGKWKLGDMKLKTGDNDLDTYLNAYMEEAMAEVFFEADVMEFTADGKVNSIDSDGAIVETINYSVSGNKLTIQVTEGSFTFNIRVDGNNKLTIAEKISDYMKYMDNEMLEGLEELGEEMKQLLLDTTVEVALNRQS